MLEPISTISNIAFIIVGLMIIKKSWYAGLATIVLGFASAGWHWTLDRQWQSFDVIMMYIMLISLIDYVVGGRYRLVAVIASVAMAGIHFLLPSHFLISIIGFMLFIALLRYYQTRQIIIITFCFFLWISTNIPYLHEWDFSHTVLDILHGISHVCASIGIYLTVRYYPSGEPKN